MAGKDRPFLITVVAVLYLLAALIMLSCGAIIIWAGAEIESLELGAAAGGMAIVVGIVQLIVSIGFFKGWGPWWYLGIIISVLSIVMGVLTLPYGILAIVLYVLILWYLFRPKVKSFFLD